MAKPTYVLLDPALRAAAKRRASERGLSVSAYIRELIRADDAAARATGGDITPLIGMLGTGTDPPTSPATNTRCPAGLRLPLRPRQPDLNSGERVSLRLSSSCSSPLLRDTAHAVAS